MENKSALDKPADAFCHRCKVKRLFKEGTITLAESKGRGMLKGKCSECNHNVVRILSKKDWDEAKGGNAPASPYDLKDGENA